MRLERLGKLKKKITSSGIEPRTFCTTVVVQCLHKIIATGNPYILKIIIVHEQFNILNNVYFKTNKEGVSR